MLQGLIPVKNILLLVWIFHQSFPSRCGCASGVLSEYVFIVSGASQSHGVVSPGGGGRGQKDGW